MLFLSIAYVIPPIDDFDPGNPFWNGLSRLYEILDAKPIGDLGILDTVDPRISALIVVGPSERFDEPDAKVVERFLSSGGMVLVLDDFGYANTLLEKLNLRFRFNGSLLLDPLFMEKSRIAPKITRIELEGFESTDSLVFNYATIIDGEGFDILAYSSRFSFLDLDYDLSWGNGEPLGPFPVIVSTRIGSGSIIAVSDSSIFINSMLNYDGNINLLYRLLSGRIVYIDVSHRAPSIHAKLKYSLNTVLNILSIPEFKYLVVAVIVYSILRVRVSFGKVRSEVEELLNRHPRWDKRILERIREDLG